MCGQPSNAGPDTTADERAEHLRNIVERDYATLFRRVGVLVYRICGRLRRDEVADRVKEVLNEAVIRALRSAGNYDPARSALAWVVGFALHVLQEQRRGQSRRAVVQTDLQGETWKQALEGLCTASESDATTIRLDIRQALGRLDDRQRHVLELRYFEGLDGDELAKELGALFLRRRGSV